MRKPRVGGGFLHSLYPYWSHNMRAETQAIIDQIRESLALLRRHL